MLLTTEEQNFDRTVKQFGGRLDIQNLNAPFRLIFERLRSDIISYLSRRKEDPIFSRTNFEIHFDFVNNTSFNAMAFCVDNTYYIGLFSGTVLYLNDFMLKLLSDHRIFPDVGDFRKENKTIVDFNNEISLTYDPSLLGKTESQSIPYATLPKDGVRAIFAMYIAELASYFLVFHELAHILFGHLSYLYDHTDSMGIQEVGASYVGTIPTRTLKALELDADASAITPFFSIADFTGTLPSDQKFKYLTFLWDKKDNLYWASAISINVIFRLLSAAGLVLDSYEYSTHPHAQMRFGYALESATEFYESNRPKELKGFRSGWTRANKDCYMIWQLLKIPFGETYNESTWVTILNDLSAELIRIKRQLIPLF